MPRFAATLGLVVAVAALAATAPAGARESHHRLAAQATASLELQVLAEVNAVRAQHGLAKLRIAPSLSAAARQHSTSMAQKGYFSHSSADGAAFWRRIQNFYGSHGYRSWSVGENLLWASPGVDAAGALNMWMHSPEHRANLLEPRWHEIGLSAVHVAHAPGAFGGLEVTIVTADFGIRSR